MNTSIKTIMASIFLTACAAHAQESTDPKWAMVGSPSAPCTTCTATGPGATAYSTPYGDVDASVSPAIDHKVYEPGQASSVGFNARAAGTNASAFGANAAANAIGTIAIGAGASAGSIGTGDNFVDKISTTVLSGTNAVAIGTSARAEHDNSVALGANCNGSHLKQPMLAFNAISGSQ